MLFTNTSKRRIAKAVLATYLWTQAGLGMFSAAYAQAPAMPIADPRAPMAFQPTIQSLPNGPSVVNITTPNAAGLSLNQYQQFDVPTSGVVLNNSQIGGTPLLGGSVSANPHLTGGTANTIVNEVTVQGSPSQINGTIEVFGNPASVIVANPNGITCNGCGIVNSPRLSFSTGSITLQDVNGTSSNFDLASGVGYNVQGGQVSIQGTGIEGTVGRIDLIGELLRIDGPLRAHYLNQGISSINLTAGKTPGAGSLTTSSNGSANSTSGSTVAIDATALGAMTAGRITVISTDVGMGVNLRGPMLAYQEDVNIQSAGRVTTGDVAASRDIHINADGFVITGGTVAANDNLQVSGKDGVYVATSASANKGINLTSAQGGVTAQGPLVTSGDLNVQAAQAVKLNSDSTATQVAGNTNLKGDTVSIFGKFTGGKDVTINAHSGAGIFGDATIGGNLSMQTGGDAALFGKVQVNQSAKVSASQVSTSGSLTVGQNMDMLGTDTVNLHGSTTVGSQFNVSGGTVTLAGDLAAGQTTVDAQQLNLGDSDGNLNVRGNLDLNVSRSFHNTGNVNVTGSLGINTGGDAQFDGSVTTGSSFGVTAAGNVGVNGAVNSGGSVSLTAGNNLDVGNTITAGSGVSGTANGNIDINGAVNSGGNVNLTAGNNLQVGNTITAGGGVNGTAGGDISVNGQVNSAGSQTWHAGGDFTASGGLQGNNVNVQGNNVNIGGTVLGNGAVTIAANNNLQLSNEVRANGNVSLSSEHGGITAQSVFSNGSVGMNSAGALDVQTVQAMGDVSLSSTNSQVTAQSLLAGRDLTINAQDRISATDAGAGRHVTIQSAQGDVALTHVSAGENLSVTASQGVQVAGGVTAGGNASLTSQNAGVTAQTILANGDITTQALGDIVVAGEIASGGNGRLTSSAGKVDLAGPLYAAQSIAVEGTSVQLAQGLQSGGSATVVANTGNINSDAGLAAMGDVQLQSAGSTTVAGSVQSAGSIALQSGADTRISGDLVAEQAINTQIGGALVANNVAAGGNASLVAGSIATNEVQVGGQASLVAQQDITVAHNLMAGSITTESVNGNTTIGGQVGTAGALSMSSGGNITAGDVVAGVANGDSSSINATGSVQLASLQAGGDYVGRAGQNHVVAGDMAVQGHADVQAGGSIAAGSLAAGRGLQAQAGGDITVNGDALILGNARLVSGESQQIAGNLQVTDQLVSNAQTGLQVGGDLVANNGLQVTSTAGSLVVGGVLGTQGTASVNAANGIQVGSDVLANSVDFTSAGGGVAIGGNLSAQSNASLQAQQDIAIAGATAVMGNLQANSSAGSITFADNLQVAGEFVGHANKDLNFLGDSLLLGQADLKADIGRINNQGNMTFGQAVNINTTGDLVNEGTIQSQSGVTISARNIDSNLVNKGGISSGGDLSLTASGTARVGQEGTLSAAQDMTVQAAGGTQSAGTIQAGQDLHYAGGVLSNSGTVAAQNADLQSGLSNQGKVYVQNSLGVSGSSSNSGEIAANTLTMASLDNSGKVGAQSATLGATNNSGEIATNTVDISGGLSNTGSVSGSNSVSVNGGSTSNDGTIAGGSVTLAGSSITNGGQIQSSGAMIIAGGSFENRLQESKSCPTPGGCTTPDTYDYSQTPGTISAGTTLDINVGSATNKGVIHAGSDITINGALNNERSTNDPYTSAGASGGAVSGIISAGGDLKITGPSVQNSGQLQAGNTVQITSSGAFTNAAPTEDVAGQVIGKSVKITAGTINNEGLVLAQAGNVDLIASSGAITNKGTVATTGDLNVTASGAVSNAKDGKLLGNNITIKGDSFSNAGIVYGQNAPPSKVTIQTNGGFSNAATGVVIAGEKLDIKAGGYSNAGGTVGSLQDATLNMAGTYSPAGNALVALGKLDLQVGGISVGQGQSWNVASSDVSWTGKLTNYGTVAIAGNASGAIDNLSSGNSFYYGSPNVYNGTYQVLGYPTGLTDVSVVGYTDVDHRAQLYIGGAFTGSLLNRASDASVGGSFGLDQQHIDQIVTWEGKDANGDTVRVDTTSRTMARINTGSGTSNITLTGPNTGTIVGDGVIINGGNITIQPGIDPATGLPLVTNAQNTNVNAGNAQAGDSADITTMHTKPMAVDDPNAVGSTNVAGTNTSGAGAGSGSNGGAGDVGSAGTPVAGNGDGADPTAPVTPSNLALNLKDPIFQTPEGAVAVLMGSQFNPQWPNWDQLRVVPGSISANDLQLNLDGRFTNHGNLEVTNQLIINAAEGIDNFDASIKAGGNVTLTGKYLNNDQGSIQAGMLLTDVSGDISNNLGRIVASNGGYMQAGGNINAEQGSFSSDSGKFVLSSEGDINLIASKVEGKNGVGVNAGGNINLGAKQTTQTVHSDKNLTVTEEYSNSSTGSDTVIEGTRVIGSREKNTSTTTTSIGTTLQSSDGSVAVTARGKLAINGGSISAGQDVLLKGSDVKVQAIKETTTSSKEQSRTVDGRETDRDASTTHNESYSGGTVTAGGKVAIIANGDASKGSGNVLLAGSQVEGNQGVGISAAGNVELTALQATNTATTSGNHTTFGSTKNEGESTTVVNQSTVVGSSDGNVQIVAKGDVGIVGSNVNAAKDVAIQGSSITVQAVKDSTFTNDYEKRGSKEGRLAQGNETLKGAEIIAGGNITLNANGTPVPKNAGTGTSEDPIASKPTLARPGSGAGNITLEGATVVANGDTTLVAKGDVNVLDIQTEHSSYAESYSKSSGFLSKKSTHTIDDAHSSISEGSIVKGSTVNIGAVQDINVIGSHVVGDQGVNMVAGNDINIVAGQDAAQASSHKETKKSGLFGSGGFGITLGSSKVTTDHENESIRAASSSVQSSEGSVAINAGNHYQQTGSAVLAKENIDISAKSVDITEARELERDKFDMRAKQSGLTLAFSNPVLDVVQSAQNTAGLADATGKTSNTRAQAMGAVSTGLAAYDTATQAAALAANPSAAASVGINLSIGSSSSHSSSNYLENTASGSKVHADGNVSITATEGDLRVRGSTVEAGKDLSLDAQKGNLVLEAAGNGYIEESSHTSSSASIGVGFNVGAQNGFTINASASQSKGQGNGEGVSYSNTNIKAGGTASLHSGQDTTLRGATVVADAVKADVGGDLSIESLQDTSTYKETNSSSGFGVSLCIPPICYGSSSVSVSGGRGKVDSNYASVGEQSGIHAGDGGFDVNVGGDTTLKGGAITSTQKAIDEGKNSFATGGTLAMSDIENSAKYDANSWSATGTVAGQLGDQSTAKTPEEINAATNDKGKPGGSAGVGSASGKADSTSYSGISGVAGKQDMRTGDAETGVKPIFDKERVNADVNAQVQITQDFGKRTSSAWGKYANQQFIDAMASGDEASAQCWAPDGGCRAAGHALIGGMTGGAGGAASAGLSSMTAPLVINTLTDAGLPKPVVDALVIGYGAGTGAALGGVNGATAGVNETANNSLAVPIAELVIQGVLRGGATAAAACSRSPKCVEIVSAAVGTGAAAWLTQLANPSENTASSVTMGDVNPHLFGGTESLNPADEPQKPVSGTEGKPIQGGAAGDSITVSPIDGKKPDVTLGGKPIGQTQPGDGLVYASPITPVPEPIPAGNGLIYGSNDKHTPGAPGSGRGQGVEPRNSIDLFNDSVPSIKDPDGTRYTKDANGDIHRFSNDGNGNWHWSGSTGDVGVPLDTRPIPNLNKKQPPSNVSPVNSIKGNK